MKYFPKFELKPEKGNALLQLLLDKVGGSYDYKSLLKLAFFADRFHIRNYVRPIVGDIYFAMKHGPAPEYMKDSIEDSIEDSLISSDNSDEIIVADPRFSKYQVKLKNISRIDKTVFSKSDLEAIDFAVDQFGKSGYNVWKIIDLSHAYPEWDKYKNLFENKITKRQEMNYLDFLENANPNHPEFKKHGFQDPFLPLTEGDRQDLIDEINDITSLYSDK